MVVNLCVQYCYVDLSFTNYIPFELVLSTVATIFLSSIVVGKERVWLCETTSKTHW